MVKKNLLLIFVILFCNILKAQTPVISTFSPASAGAGNTVVIAGTNLTGATSVQFGGVPAASFTVLGSTAISAVVGAGATGSVSVTTASGTASLAGFTYQLSMPSIASFLPASGPIGTTVTITGSNFSTTLTDNIVFFGAVRATVTSATNSTLSVVVPAGASFKPISVTINGYTAFSSKPFIVTFLGADSLFSANTFGNRKDITATIGQKSVEITDMDGDGKPDLVLMGGYFTFYSLLNTSTGVGNISFDTAVNYNFKSISNSKHLIQDFDGDGKPDVAAMSNTYGKIAVWANSSTLGKITFLTEINIITNTNPTDICSGDVDGDGRPDLLVTYSGNANISVYLNTSTVGNISFGSKNDISITSGTGIVGSRAILLNDIDGDGKLDILFKNSSTNKLGILRNKSTGAGIISFATEVDFTVGTDPIRFCIGDFDGNGKPDIAVVNGVPTSLSILLNKSTKGNFSFYALSTYQTMTNSYPQGIQTADLDGDGKLDLTIANGMRSLSISKNSGILGANFYEKMINFPTATQSSTLRVNDLDGDGKPEILTLNDSSNFISIYRNLIVTPSIISFTPTSADGGTIVTISGTNLKSVTGVSFGGVKAFSFTKVNDSTITAVVGAGASGDVSVTVPGGSVSLGGFTFINVNPIINSFNPIMATTGTIVTIKGSNFIGTTNVSFGGINASSFTVLNDSVISAIVGSGATGNLNVTTNNGSAFIAGFMYCTPAIILNNSLYGCNSVVKGGITYTNSTIVIDTIKSSLGCDSVYVKTTININKPISKNVNFTGCYSLLYNGIVYTSSTILYDTLKSFIGCDSVYRTINLNVEKIQPTYTNITLSDADSVTYKNRIFKSSIVFFDTLRSLNGCDSIYQTIQVIITKVPGNFGFERNNFNNWNTYLDSTFTIPSSYTQVSSHNDTTGGNTTMQQLFVDANKLSARATWLSITGGGVLDKYGNYPIVCNLPGAGNHSCKIGSDSIVNRLGQPITGAAGICYNFRIPTNKRSYKLVFYYAVNVEDPGKGTHECWELPFFNVTPSDSLQTTRDIGCQPLTVNRCDSAFFSNFTKSSIISQNSYPVYTSKWMPATMIIKNMGGRVLSLKCLSAGCSPSFGGQIGSPGIHFSYGYIDFDTINAASYNADTLRYCAKDTSFSFSPPPGYKQYIVYDSITNRVIGLDTNHLVSSVNKIYFNGANIPKARTTMKVVLIPYAWYGNRDTISYFIDTFSSPQKPVVSYLTDSINLGDTIRLNINSLPSNLYTWSGPNGFYSTATSPIVTSTTSQSLGKYYVQAINVNTGCISDSSYINVVTKNAGIFVSGNIITPLSKNVSNVLVNINSSLGSVFSNTSGVYSSALPTNTNIALKAYKNNDVKKSNGVTTLDIALVQSHILQKNILNNPYKIIAADVNGDGKVTTLDIVYLKRLILGLDTTFIKTSTGEKRLWAFVDSAYVFPNTSDPFPYKDSISFSGLNASKTNQTFIGCKLGDVNWDWNAAIAKFNANDLSKVELSGHPYLLNDKRTIKIPISVKNFKELMGIQFAISFNSTLYKLVGIHNNTLNIETGQNHIGEGKINFLWNNPNNEGKTLDDGTVVFELEFEKLTNDMNTEIEPILNLDGNISDIVAIDKEFVEHGVILNEKQIIALNESEKESWVITPNPTIGGAIHIMMKLNQKKNVITKLLDNTGKFIISEQFDGAKGNNSFTIRYTTALISGEYYLQVIGIDGVSTQKIIIIN